MAEPERGSQKRSQWSAVFLYDEVVIPPLTHYQEFCILEDMVWQSQDLTIVSMSTLATGSHFELQGIEDAKSFENGMVEYNSWTYSGTSMNTSAGYQANLADNWMKCCSKLYIGVGGAGTETGCR